MTQEMLNAPACRAFHEACRYARSYLVKSLKPELEDIIMTDERYSYFYASDIIKGKLPEKMHNMMLLRAIEDPNNIYVKNYFEFIK